MSFHVIKNYILIFVWVRIPSTHLNYENISVDIVCGALSQVAKLASLQCSSVSQKVHKVCIRNSIYTYISRLGHYSLCSVCIVSPQSGCCLNYENFHLLQKTATIGSFANYFIKSHCNMWDLGFSRRWVRWDSSPWWWRQQGPLKRWFTSTRLHGATIQKTAIFTLQYISCQELLPLAVFRIAPLDHCKTNTTIGTSRSSVRKPKLNQVQMILPEKVQIKILKLIQLVS
jgi:hypothetical protein